MTNTPTPRTDAARPPFIELQEFVPASFARTLERELAEKEQAYAAAYFDWRDDREKLREQNAELGQRATRAEAELAALKGPSSFLVSPEFMQQHLALEKDNAALRAALTQIAEWKDDTGAWLYTEEAIQIARAALAKEGGR